MKTVFVQLEGIGPVYWFDHLTDPENCDMVPVDDCDYRTLAKDGWVRGIPTGIALILRGIKVWVYQIIDKGNGHVESKANKDITRMKGKYALANNYFSDILGFKTPFYFHRSNTCEIIECYRIHLKDDEEFDPKKLQLIKTDRELSYIPSGIITSHIMYDGKMYGTDFLPKYNPNCELRWIYNEEQPSASSNLAISLSRDMIVKQ